MRFPQLDDSEDDDSEWDEDDDFDPDDLSILPPEPPIIEHLRRVALDLNRLVSSFEDLVRASGA